ncbi:MAG: (2Fe-2S)-binding protein [Promethearchaeota archaeon]
MIIEIFVNGELYKEKTSPDQRLLDFLRDDLGLKGTKKGCDQGECGACTVIMNGKMINSCLVLMVQIPKRSEIETIESKDSLVLSLQDSFMESGAIQCGACTPGMIMASAALLKEKPNADIREIREGLSGVICRCTGYQKIFDAITITQQRMQE